MTDRTQRITASLTSALITQFDALDNPALVPEAFAVAHTLANESSPTGLPISASDYLSRVTWVRQNLSARCDYPEILEMIDQAKARLYDPAGELVATEHGCLRWVDLLSCELINLVHGCLRAGLIPVRPALAHTTRTLATVLASRFPGRTIEVRIPPFAAVQLGSLEDGSVHRRGIPPNVVQTDPATFLAICWGDSSFDEAIECHKLTSSGVHARDLAQMVPVVGRSTKG